MPIQRFETNVTVVGRIPAHATTKAISGEPMLFSSSVDFAIDNGGPLTRLAIAALPMTAPPRGLHAVIDTRSHMLMPGQYPAIPGWHCDAVPRPNGQPDFARLDVRQRHYTVTVAEDGRHMPMVEFFAPQGCPAVDLRYTPMCVWASLNETINGLDEIYIRYGEHGDVMEFSSLVPHRAQSSPGRGWRWFFRLSYMEKPPKNEIRRQVQVYTTEGLGW